MCKVSCDHAGAWRRPFIIKKIDCADILNIFFYPEVCAVHIISIKVWAVMKSDCRAASITECQAVFQMFDVFYRARNRLKNRRDKKNA